MKDLSNVFIWYSGVLSAVVPFGLVFIHTLKDWGLLASTRFNVNKRAISAVYFESDNKSHSFLTLPSCAVLLVYCMIFHVVGSRLVERHDFCFVNIDFQGHKKIAHCGSSVATMLHCWVWGCMFDPGRSDSISMGVECKNAHVPCNRCTFNTSGIN